AGHLDHAAALRLDGRARDRVVPRERLAHALRLLLPQAGAALDVREEEGGDRCVVHVPKALRDETGIYSKLRPPCPCAPSPPPATSRRCARGARCPPSSRATTTGSTCSSFAARGRGRGRWWPRSSRA